MVQGHAKGKKTPAQMIGAKSKQSAKQARKHQSRKNAPKQGVAKGYRDKLTKELSAKFTRQIESEMASRVNQQGGKTDLVKVDPSIQGEENKKKARLKGQ